MPDRFGKKNGPSWRTWSHLPRDFVGVVHAGLKQAMKNAEKRKLPIAVTNVQHDFGVTNEMDQELQHFLIARTEGEAVEVVRGAEGEDDLNLIMTFSPCSSRSNTSPWASRNIFVRAQSYRFSPYNGCITLLHLAYFHLSGDVNLDISVHHRIHIGRSSGRNVVDCSCIRRQRQISTSSVLPRRQHIGYAFLNAVTTTHRHQPRSWRQGQTGVIVKRTHCNIFRVER